MDPVHETEEKQPTVTSKFRTFLVLFCSLLAVAGVTGTVWCWNLYQSMYRSTDISLLGKEPPRSSVFYDRNGEFITELTNSKMEYMPLDQFPKKMLDAVIAVEDSRFYEHKGIDFYGIARAFYRNLKSGDTVEGGSTITQQLAKTMLFSTEQTYSRKLNEAVASIKIEHSYTKDQILELYLNHIYFGEGAWGLQRAAETYFGKNTAQLTLAECALLAAIPKSPVHYSPVKKPGQAKERRDLVLNLMAEQGKITAEERDKAKKEPVMPMNKPAPKTAKIYPSYIDHVINEAIAKYGLTEQQILSSGLHIYTNLDPKVQKAAEEVYKDASYFPEDAGGLQSGIVLLEPQTGAILGIAGSRNPNQEFREFNYATQSERQPGSTIKPIMVYAPALIEGYGPGDYIYDEETDFGGGYKPMNYMGQFHGWVTLEEALVQSYNIPAVAMLKEIGIGKGMDFAKQAGLPLQDSDRTFGIALGGMSKGTSPLQMAQAYTVFANGGRLAQAYAITKITNKQGQLVGKESHPVLQSILDPNIAYTMTKMLEKVVQEGTGQNARMDRPVAGKTGTTQLPDIEEFKDENGNQLDGSKDAWFVGYTPEIVAAVWLGYEKTNKTHYLTTTGGKYPASLFKEVVSRALQDAPVTDFAKPESYRLMVGGSKRINGTKEAMLALAARNQRKEPQPEKETAVEAAADNQQNASPDSMPDKLTDQKDAGKPGGQEKAHNAADGKAAAGKSKAGSGGDGAPDADGKSKADAAGSGGAHGAGKDTGAAAGGEGDGSAGEDAGMAGSVDDAIAGEDADKAGSGDGGTADKDADKDAGKAGSVDGGTDGEDAGMAGSGDGGTAGEDAGKAGSQDGGTAGEDAGKAGSQDGGTAGEDR